MLLKWIFSFFVFVDHITQWFIKNYYQEKKENWAHTQQFDAHSAVCPNKNPLFNINECNVKLKHLKLNQNLPESK